MGLPVNVLVVRSRVLEATAVVLLLQHFTRENDYSQGLVYLP